MTETGPEILHCANHPDRELWEKQINASYRACGCNESALGLGAGVIAAGIYVAARTAEPSAPWLSAMAVVGGAAVAGAIQGSGAGRVRANIKLQKTIDTIRPHWKDDRPSGKGILLCG